MDLNRARILKLLPWIQLIQWYFLAGIVLSILGMVAMGVNYFINPDMMNAFTGGHNNYLYISGLVLKNLNSLLMAVFFYLLFVGVSYTIRYLLAMKDTLQKATR